MTLSAAGKTDFPAIRRRRLETLQANLGYRCNQSCLHCHVAASQKRTEEMDWETMALLLVRRKAAHRHAGPHRRRAGNEPAFPPAGDQSPPIGLRVIDRCNLIHPQRTGLRVAGRFLADNAVENLGLAALLSGERRPAAGRRRLSIEPRRPAQAQCPGLWRPRQRAHPQPRHNPLGPTLPPIRPGSKPPTRTSNWQRATASASTSCSRWPTCRSSALAASSFRARSSRVTWRY